MSEFHPIIYTSPLIVPQQRFTDINGRPCAFQETNPSIYIDQETGDTTILVRCVDYRKFADKSFTLYQRQSNSIYYIGHACLKPYNYLTGIDIEFKPVNVDYGISKYPTYWTGLEDIRFLDSANSIIATIPECNERGQPAIFKATLTDNTISKCIPLKPNGGPEKNWMPFNSKVIYNLDPFTIKSLDSDDCKILGNYSELSQYHGSSNGILFNDNFLFLIHVNRERTYHRWILYNQKDDTLKISREFIFFRNSYIEFTCSLAQAFDRIFVSCGVNDDKAFILELSSLDILSFF